MKAAKETEATTAEQHARESIRVARTTRELLKKFAAAYRIFQELEECEGHQQVTRLEFRGGSTIFTDDDVHDKIAITKELFLLVIQDRDVQRLMDELDLPPDRANLFEVHTNSKPRLQLVSLDLPELKGTLEAELQKLKPAIPQRYHPRVANV